jgi:HAD superfamily hydrolase (TIGR01450 family)
MSREPVQTREEQAQSDRGAPEACPGRGTRPGPAGGAERARGATTAGPPEGRGCPSREERAQRALLRRPGRWFDGYAFDLDGTVYLGDELLPGAAETIRRIRAAGGSVAFATNKPLETAADYAAKLTRLGVPAAPADVLTALDTLLRYLAERHPAARLLTIAEPLVEATLADAGWRVVRDPAEADVVVVSFDRTFDYAKLDAAYRAVRHHGATIVATNPDPYCPTPEGGLPDCAAMLAALEACTGARAEAVLGKPSAMMARALLGRLGTAPAGTAMVGDRLTTDVAMGQAAGMAGVLVLSGATTPAALAASDVRPDYVIAGIGHVLPDQTGDSRE